MNLTQSIRRCLGSRGSGSIEFAFFSTLAVTVLLCGVDLVNYARNRLTLDEVSNSLASLITGYKDLYEGDFPMLYQVSQQTAGALDITKTGGATIFTGIASLTSPENPTGAPRVMWQRQTPASNTAFLSSFGRPGGAPAKMPDNYVVPNGSSVVAVEVFSSVQTWTYTLTKDTLGKGSQPITGSLTMLQPRSALLSQVSPETRP